MDFKGSFWKGIRTFFQTFAGLAASIPTVDAIAKIKVIGSSWLLAVFGAVAAGIVSFAQNAGESAAGQNILPGGPALPVGP